MAFRKCLGGRTLVPRFSKRLTVEDDAIYFLGTFGEVFRINRKTGKADWKIKLLERYRDAQTPK